MDNSINFKGAFLIKQPTVAFKDAIIPALGKKKLIINNINRNGDVLYVVRDNADKNVADFILNAPGTKFTYFQDLNTKSGFDAKKPREAMQKIKEYKGFIISTANKLSAKIRQPLKAAKSSIKVTQDKNLKVMQDETHVDFSDKKFRKNVDVQTGVFTIKTYVNDIITGKKREHTLLSITPPGKFGVCYAKYTPVAKEDTIRRIAIKNGKKIFEYVASSADQNTNEKGKLADQVFNTNVKNAKEFYKMQLAKKTGNGSTHT